MRKQQDLFISHASADQEQYIRPLADALTTQGVTFWLDTVEIEWGDNVTKKINIGLSGSRYALLCLSRNYLHRPWPEAEMTATLALQNSGGSNRVLPLFLNSKEQILQEYPLLASLAYREFSAGVDVLARELSTLIGNQPKSPELVRILIESAHTGQLCNLVVSRRVSVKWLATKARAGLNVRERLEAGDLVYFHIRWVLVDVKAEPVWIRLPRSKMRTIHAVVKANDGVRYSTTETDRLEDIGVYDGIIFHLFPIEDEDYDIERSAAACMTGLR